MTLEVLCSKVRDYHVTKASQHLSTFVCALCSDNTVVTPEALGSQINSTVSGASTDSGTGSSGSDSNSGGGGLPGWAKVGCLKVHWNVHRMNVALPRSKCASGHMKGAAAGCIVALRPWPDLSPPDF